MELRTMRRGVRGDSGAWKILSSAWVCPLAASRVAREAASGALLGAAINAALDRGGQVVRHEREELVPGAFLHLRDGHRVGLPVFRHGPIVRYPHRERAGRLRGHL